MLESLKVKLKIYQININGYTENLSLLKLAAFISDDWEDKFELVSLSEVGETITFNNTERHKVTVKRIK